MKDNQVFFYNLGFRSLAIPFKNPVRILKANIS